MNKWKGSFPVVEFQFVPKIKKASPLTLRNNTVVESDKRQQNSQDILDNLKKQIVFSYHKTISLIIVC